MTFVTWIKETEGDFLIRQILLWIMEFDHDLEVILTVSDLETNPMIKFLLIKEYSF